MNYFPYLEKLHNKYKFSSMFYVFPFIFFYEFYIFDIKIIQLKYSIFVCILSNIIIYCICFHFHGMMHYTSTTSIHFSYYIYIITITININNKCQSTKIKYNKKNKEIFFYDIIIYRKMQ